MYHPLFVTCFAAKNFVANSRKSRLAIETVAFRSVARPTIAIITHHKVTPAIYFSNFPDGSLVTINVYLIAGETRVADLCYLKSRSDHLIWVRRGGSEDF